MMDERSKNMRDLLFALPTAPDADDMVLTINGPRKKSDHPIFHGNPIPEQMLIQMLGIRCICCGGIGINHDEQ